MQKFNTHTHTVLCNRFLQNKTCLTFSYGLLHPKPNMSRWPWESVQAKCWPSAENLQSKTAPWPCPSIWNRSGKSRLIYCVLCSHPVNVVLTDTPVKTRALYHVKEVSYLGPSAEVPDVNVPIVPGREHNSPVKRVGFQHKHFVIMSLHTNT